MMIARRRARASRAFRIIDREGPVLEFELTLVAGQHDIGGLVQERWQAPIATFRDAANLVDLPGLIPPGNNPRQVPVKTERRRCRSAKSRRLPHSVMRPNYRCKAKLSMLTFALALRVWFPAL